jgi:salicylate hydroxylase
VKQLTVDTFVMRKLSVARLREGFATQIEDAIILAEMLAAAPPAELGAVLCHYQALRRGRVRKIQRSSRATNDLLHLPDGPTVRERDQRVSRFPEDFGWIHEFDALRSVPKRGGPLAGAPLARGER